VSDHRHSCTCDEGGTSEKQIRRGGWANPETALARWGRDSSPLVTIEVPSRPSAGTRQETVADQPTEERTLPSEGETGDSNRIK